MSRKIVLILFLIGLSLWEEILLAQDFSPPEATLIIQQGVNKESLRIKIVLSRSAPDCDFWLWAYGRSKFAQEIPGQGILTASFGNPRTEIDLAAVDLKPLQSGLPLKSKNVFFRLLLTCEDGGSYPSEIVAYPVPQRTKNGARSKRDWMLRLKREINYAELIEGE